MLILPFIFAGIYFLNVWNLTCDNCNLKEIFIWKVADYCLNTKLQWNLSKPVTLGLRFLGLNREVADLDRWIIV